MTKGKIIALCLICLLISGIIAANGYTNYQDYKANKTNTEIGKDILGQNEETIKEIQNTIDWVYNKLNFNIGDYFRELWMNIKKAFEEIFDWVPGNDFDDDNEGFAGGGDGFGGGSGGARG